jgi:hypothetical protein
MADQSWVDELRLLGKHDDPSVALAARYGSSTAVTLASQYSRLVYAERPIVTADLGTCFGQLAQTASDVSLPCSPFSLFYA